MTSIWICVTIGDDLFSQTKCFPFAMGYICDTNKYINTTWLPMA